jgi:NADH-quinone oxidoreductase subunit M
MDQHLLSIVLLTPLAGLALLLFFPGKSKDLIRVWANLVTFAGFLISLPLVSRFQVGRSGYQFEETFDWIPSLGAHYHIGIDGISLLLIILTTLMGFIAMLCSWNAIQDRVKEYYAMFLLLQVGMLGGNWCWCRCTSSSACGAAPASCTRPSSSSSTPWPAAC